VSLAAPAAPEPSERWGILYASVWLTFLIFPVVDAAQLDAPGWVRALLLTALAAFAGVYVAAWVGEHSRPDAAQRRTPAFAAVLLALWAAVSTQLGSTAMGMLVFVVVLCCLLGSPRVATVAVVVVPALAGLTWWVTADLAAAFLFGLVALMTVVSLVLRGMEQQRETRRVLQEETAVATERERVARDVHDVLGHSLTVITTKAELAQRLLEKDTPETRARAVAELADVQSLGREALAEVRATVAGLRVARLGEELAGADRALGAAGIDAEVPVDVSVVDPRRRLVLAWVLREAVTNVVRHSGATRCVVELGQHSLVVRDDGRGVAGTVQGNGLRGLAERVAAAGGVLRLTDTSPGTRLEVSWP
jgi:two-component system, NarL family, sensor histidine kinase DesK